MVDTVVKITCEFCENYLEASKDLNKYLGEKTFRKRCNEKYGWLKVVNGNGSISDFCSVECYELNKKDETE